MHKHFHKFYFPRPETEAIFFKNTGMELIIYCYALDFFYTLKNEIKGRGINNDRSNYRSLKSSLGRISYMHYKAFLKGINSKNILFFKRKKFEIFFHLLTFAIFFAFSSIFLKPYIKS